MARIALIFALFAGLLTSFVLQPVADARSLCDESVLPCCAEEGSDRPEAPGDQHERCDDCALCKAPATSVYLPALAPAVRQGESCDVLVATVLTARPTIESVPAVPPPRA